MGGRRHRRFWWVRLIVTVIVCALAVVGAITVVNSPVVKRWFCPVNYEEAVEAAAARHNLNPLLVCAIIKCESNWDAAAISSAGAVGLMQVMPSTAVDLQEMGRVEASYDADNLTDPETNLEFGCAYLAFLAENLVSTEEIVAAYNAGLATVRGWLESGEDIVDAIQYSETRSYLERVVAALKDYREAYPEGLATSD